jgi:branched-chain amino acid transport system substrate-binding protein
MREKKFFETIFILMMCLSLLLGLNLSPASAQKKPAYKLGVNLDITGYSAWTGEPASRGIQLFAEQINAKGGIDGHPIELVVYDNETNTEKSANNVKKLIQRDKVIAIFGTVLTATSNAAKPFAQEAKVVMYTYSASFEPDYPDSFCFSTMVSTPDLVERIYDYIKEKGIKRVAGLFVTDSTGQAWFEESNKAAKQYGVEIASERFNVKDMDVTAQLAKLKAINPQVLIVGVSGGPNAVVAKNFNQMGFKIPYITGTGNLSDIFLNLMKGNEPETLLIPGPYYCVWRDLPDSFPQKKLMKEFTDAFQQKFKREADMYAAEAYDSARIMAEVLKQVNPGDQSDSVKIRDGIERIKDFPAVYGRTFSLSKTDHRGVHKDACLMIGVKEGRFVIGK